MTTPDSPTGAAEPDDVGSGSGASRAPTAVAVSGSRPLPRSVLLSAPRSMGSTARAAVPAILVTAAVQAVLMYLDAQSGFTIAFLLSFLASAAVTLLLYAVLTACALAVVAAPPTASGSDPRSVGGRLRAHGGLFAVWAIAQWAAILLVSVVNPLLVAAVAVLTPFLPLAAMDGHRNALATNLRVIAQRPGRWLLTIVVLLVAALVLFLLSVANTLFVQGTPAAVIFWLVIGVVAWWVLTAWALVYRSVAASAPGP